jgi:hypothetical protein
MGVDLRGTSQTDCIASPSATVPRDVLRRRPSAIRPQPSFALASNRSPRFVRSPESAERLPSPHAAMFIRSANLSRREFLLRTGAGFGAVALAALEHSARESLAARPAVDPLRPMAARPPHTRPRATSVIFLFLVGGPSPVDTFDYKPTLQRLNGQKVPRSIRDAVAATRHANVFHGCKEELLASPFKFAQYGQSGMWVSELWPHLARHVDDLCFIHSLQSESNNHAPSSYQLHTGEVRPGKASLGSWVTYGLGSENEDLPGYVVLFDAGPLGGAANYTNGFLPPAFQPTRLRDNSTPVLDLTPPVELADGQRDTLDLIRELNLIHRAQRPERPDLDARIATYELSYRMQSAALEVGQADQETRATRREYALEHGEPRTASFGRKCLLARRLVERGVRFVQVYDMPDKDGWDAHDNIKANHVPRALWTDQPIAALLADLKQRGLWDQTLVICASEFGRTPMMQGNNGRQHNAAGFTIWMGGGGVQPGQRIGATDDIGRMVVERPMPLRDLHATILAALGLDHEELSFETSGRQERLTGVAGSAKPIEGVLG